MATFVAKKDIDCMSWDLRKQSSLGCHVGLDTASFAQNKFNKGVDPRGDNNNDVANCKFIHYYCVMEITPPE